MCKARCKSIPRKIFPFYQHCHNELLRTIERQEAACGRDLVSDVIYRNGWHELRNDPESVADIATVRLSISNQKLYLKLKAIQPKCVINLRIYFSPNLLFLAQQRPVGQGLLIHKVSRSHTTTHHSRYENSGRVISSSQRPLRDNTHNTHNRQMSMPPMVFETII